MRTDYLESARRVIDEPYILVNVVSRRVKQLRRGSRPLVESLEKLSPEDIALREIAEGKIGYELDTSVPKAPASRPSQVRTAIRPAATPHPFAELAKASAGS